MVIYDTAKKAGLSIYVAAGVAWHIQFLDGQAVHVLSPDGTQRVQSPLRVSQLHYGGPANLEGWQIEEKITVVFAATSTATATGPYI